MLPPAALAAMLDTNVSLGMSDVLAYAMLTMVAVFILSGVGIVLIYRRRLKRLRAAQQEPQSTAA
jgi:uncharacterized membrane protein YcjF (UPF0283 family)